MNLRIIWMCRNNPFLFTKLVKRTGKILITKVKNGIIEHVIRNYNSTHRNIILEKKSIRRWTENSFIVKKLESTLYRN